MKNFIDHRMAIVALVMLATSAPPAPAAEAGPQAVVAVQQESRLRRADCDVPGRDLAGILERAQPGDTIHLRGRCKQQVVIKVDHIRLIGEPGALLDGSGGPDGEFDAALTIDGAHGVEIQSLTVQGTNNGIGILGTGGASFAAREVLLQQHGRGMLLDDASAELDGVTIVGGFAGFQAQPGSSVLVNGAVEVSMTGDEAFSLLGATGEVRGGDLSLHDNQGLSLVVVGGSLFTILGLEASGVRRVSVFSNQGPGILLGNGALEIGGVRPGTPIVESFGNAGPGIVMVAGGKILNAVGWGRIVVTDNPIGIDASTGSVIWANGGLEVENNIAGGLVASDSTVFLSPGPGLNPISVTGNGGTGDVVLSFGARSTIGAGVTIGSSLVCDGTVLSQGDVVC